jgi:hypothetical protein
LKYPTKWLSLVLCLVLLQLLLPAADGQQPLPTELNVTVMAGEGATNNLRERAHQPVVRVEDENHRPISGAAVVFILPTEGASGDFDGSKTLVVTTDAQGVAAAHGFKTNQTPGKVVILATASYRGLTARTSITQVNADGPGAKGGGSRGHGKLIIILAAVGAAGAGGAIASMHKGSSSSAGTPPSGTPISISVGSISVGAPHP